LYITEVKKTVFGSSFFVGELIADGFVVNIANDINKTP